MTNKTPNNPHDIDAGVPQWCRTAAVLVPAALVVFALYCAFKIGHAMGVCA